MQKQRFMFYCVFQLKSIEGMWDVKPITKCKEPTIFWDAWECIMWALRCSEGLMAKWRTIVPCTFFYLFKQKNKWKKNYQKKKNDQILFQALSTPKMSKPFEKPRKEICFSPVCLRVIQMTLAGLSAGLTHPEAPRLALPYPYPPPCTITHSMKLSTSEGSDSMMNLLFCLKV